MTPLLLHLLAWFGLVILAISNGLIRENTFGRTLNHASAHAASGFVGLALFAIAVALLHRWRPLPTATQAWAVGFTWVILTMGFEFGFGRLRGVSWPQLLAMYDLSTGSLWVFVLLGTLLLPPLFHWLARFS